MNKIKCIYAIKDKRSDKVLYIGQTKDFISRKKDHFRKSNTPIDKYMFEQNRENFEMIIIEQLNDDISLEDIKMKEQEYIDKYNTYKEGLNKYTSGNKEFQKQRRQEREKARYLTDNRQQYYKNRLKSEKFIKYNREKSRINYQKKKQEKLNQEQI